MFINPVSMISLAQTTTKKDKLFKFFIELPIFGTFIYHIIVSRETINDFFLDKLYLIRSIRIGNFRMHIMKLHTKVVIMQNAYTPAKVLNIWISTFAML